MWLQTRFLREAYTARYVFAHQCGTDIYRHPIAQIVRGAIGGIGWWICAAFDLSALSHGRCKNTESERDSGRKRLTFYPHAIFRFPQTKLDKAPTVPP